MFFLRFAEIFLSVINSWFVKFVRVSPIQSLLRIVVVVILLLLLLLLVVIEGLLRLSQRLWSLIVLRSVKVRVLIVVGARQVRRLRTGLVPIGCPPLAEIGRLWRSDCCGGDSLRPSSARSGPRISH